MTSRWGASWTTVQRLRDDLPLRRDEPFSWLLTLIVTTIAFGIRFPRLGQPPEIAFDEAHYVKEAWSVLHFGYAREWPDNVTELINAGTPGDPLDQAAFVVHPMVAKWLIAAGEWIFGLTPFGWRFAALIFGCLLIAATTRLARRLARSSLIGALAGLLLAIDGLAVTMSRIALLDIFQAFFTVTAVALLIRDRDWFRERLATHLEHHHLTNLQGNFGPLLWWRPWRLGAGITFGLAIGCKWNSLYVLAVAGLAGVAFDWQARRTAGARTTAWLSLACDATSAFCHLVITAAGTYLATWASWFASSDGTDGTQGGYFRDWGVNNPDAASVHRFGKALASWWHYQVDIWQFHTGDFMASQTHGWAAHPLGWIIIAKPTLFATEYDIASGVDGCRAGVDGSCMRAVMATGTPFLWWFAAIAFVAGLVFWIAGRDWRFAVPILAMSATWLGWLPNSDRPVFFFYAIMMVPFTVTILAMCLGKIIGPPSSGRKRRRGTIIAASAVLIVLATFAFIYPIITYEVIDRSSWVARIWFG